MSIITESEEQKIRISICRICPDFNKVTEQCRVCHCFMKVKTRLEHASCKKGLWNNPEFRERVKKEVNGE